MSSREASVDAALNEIVPLRNKAEQTEEGELFELVLKCCHVC